MQKLTNAINIGKVLAEQLESIGITNIEELRKLGSRQTIIAIANKNHDICINKLYALEGAIRGIRWHYLPTETKQELKVFYRNSKRISK